MFLFENITFLAVLTWLGVFGGLVLLNELARRYRFAGLALFTALPIALTPLWLNSTHELLTWFIWSKTYTILAFALLVWILRFGHLSASRRWLFILPAVLLAVNIIEAVYREYQFAGLIDPGMLNGIPRISGAWNLVNAAAGLLNLLAISGWLAIKIEGENRDMVWRDQTIAWLICYNLWHFAFIYNLAPDQAFYTGLAVNMASLIPALIWLKGGWMQARVHTLAFYMLALMTVPSVFSVDSPAAVSAIVSPQTSWFVSGLALTANLAFFAYHLSTIIRHRRNPLTQQVHAIEPSTQSESGA